MSDRSTARSNAVSVDCPNCGGRVSFRVANPAKPIALAVYGGVPGGRGTSDAELLQHVADWLDVIDDATDVEYELAGKDHRADRGIQADLRRIAESVA